ncbi:hypothetical protein OG259_09040 [Streptomyces sp. NBC_00250]|uniref:hypothetical protein n=1 Tax=Streptomyces sp. NBC_00250 TaxID=2903641 RepID=UPI002E2D432B|nr:hypothetical protein [Streptomyces sp. NBC_00250]
MNHSENVDHDAVLRARTMLLGSDRPSLSQEVQAYRVLARVSPAPYLPKLTRALVSYGDQVGDQGGMELRLALHAEAADAARRIGADEPNRADVVCDVLSSYQRTLLTVGRRAEAFTVCEEMAEAGRIAFERGHVQSPVYGHGRLATMLAEQGDHGESAEIRGRGAARRGPEVCFWTTVEWAAELDAAGRHEDALTAFTELVDHSRAEVATKATSLANLVWELTHRSQMFDAAGRREEASADRQEVLRLLARLAEAGEPRVWSNILSWWVTLFALSGRAAEPAASREAPQPPFGVAFLHWSPDTRESYLGEIPALETRVAELTGAGRFSGAVGAHHRLVRRSAVLHERRTHRIEECLRPLFDEGVALARRLPDSPAVIARALADRAMFLVAAKRYGEAQADFAEVVGLLEGAIRPPIVTRT